MIAAVIADIVRSRELDDRAGAQRAIRDAIARAQTDAPLARTPLTAVVGDEQIGRAHV